MLLPIIMTDGNHDATDTYLTYGYDESGNDLARTICRELEEAGERVSARNRTLSCLGCDSRKWGSAGVAAHLVETYTKEVITVNIYDWLLDKLGEDSSNDNRSECIYDG